MAREFVNRVQKLRKKAGLQAIDPVEVFYELPEANGTWHGCRRTSSSVGARPYSCFNMGNVHM